MVCGADSSLGDFNRNLFNRLIETLDREELLELSKFIFYMELETDGLNDKFFRQDEIRKYLGKIRNGK